MSRRHRSIKRDVQPDPIYGNLVAAKFINHLMVQGKKSVAEHIFYNALEIVKERTRQDPIHVFLKAIDHVRPLVEVKSRRVGGATYQVPIEVQEDRGVALALRWIRDFARKRGEKNMVYRLAGEIMDAAGEEGDEGKEGGRGKGGAVKKREETHRMAEANKAFSHYRW